MVYLQYSAKLRAGRLQDFVSLLNSLTLVVAKHGWKLLGSYATVVGRLNTVVDLWGALPNEIAIFKQRYLIRKWRNTLRALADNRRPDPEPAQQIADFRSGEVNSVSQKTLHAGSASVRPPELSPLRARARRFTNITNGRGPG